MGMFKISDIMNGVPTTTEEIIEIEVPVINSTIIRVEEGLLSIKAPDNSTQYLVQEASDDLDLYASFDPETTACRGKWRRSQKGGEKKSFPRVIKAQSKDGKFKATITEKKTKVYEMEKFSDPIKEKSRLNAINAKKLRDKKKRQLYAAEEEIKNLREANQALMMEKDEAERKFTEAIKELEELRSQMKPSINMEQGNNNLSLMALLEEFTMSTGTN